MTTASGDKVAKPLLCKYSLNTFKIFCISCNSPLQVKKILCVFIQHNMLTFDYNKKGFIEYTLDSSFIMYRLRFIRYIYCAKTLYGDAAELLIEELLQRGQMMMSEVVTSVTGRLNEALEASGKAKQKKYVCLLSHSEKN